MTMCIRLGVLSGMNKIDLAQNVVSATLQRETNIVPISTLSHFIGTKTSRLAAKARQQLSSTAHVTEIVYFELLMNEMSGKSTHLNNTLPSHLHT